MTHRLFARPLAGLVILLTLLASSAGALTPASNYGQSKDLNGRTGANAAGSSACARETAGHPARSIEVGMLHSCAVLENGTVRCWGFNGDGRLGNGTEASSTIPVSVAGITQARAVDASVVHSCALLEEGKVQCWGDNSMHELGNRTAIDSSIPVAVDGVTNAIEFTKSRNYSCALLDNGEFSCWGSVEHIGRHTCSVLGDGRVQCHGSNDHGQLGNGTRIDSASAVIVSGIAHAKDVSVGMNHSCALLEEGTVKCWGQNDYGQLGNGTRIDSAVPVNVSDITNATALSVGNDASHACVRLADGSVHCWGQNNFGQLGNGTTTDSPSPVLVCGV
jgi:alpha-tubulin suppressor-like RCC1 family protein